LAVDFSKIKFGESFHIVEGNPDVLLIRFQGKVFVVGVENAAATPTSITFTTTDVVSERRYTILFS